MRSILIYQGIEYKKHQKVKFVIPSDYRIIDPQTKRILWKYGIIQFFANDKISAWVLEKGTKEPIRISLFCILPVN
tara:strand:+ start:5513 stop:5740 length:228 start_codon:yes stop_codon:yes gene_type:complete